MKKLVVLVLFLVACGDDTITPELNNGASTNNASTNNVEAPIPAPFLACEDNEAPSAFEGIVYVDADNRANSEYDHPVGMYRAIADVTNVTLITAEQRFDGQTCPDGSIRVAQGFAPFIVNLETTNTVTSRNAARFMTRAVEGEEMRMVVFGDSIPVFGPTPYFPNILRTKLQSWTSVDLENIAVSGSTSDEWIPGSVHFESRLRAQLGEADLIVFSLGGNDLQDFAYGLDPNNVTEEIGKIPAVVDQIILNLGLIIDEVRRLNPEADIVWLLYPNYARSTAWAEILTPQYASLGITFLESTLKDVRKRMAEKDILILDMLGATAGQDLDGLLIDPLHLNAAGHQFWANELFKLLGGVESDVTLIHREWAITN